MANITTQSIILCITAVATALITGLLYGYSCSVNPGLSRLSNIAYLTAMQSINQAIQNPVFFASFMGALFLLPLSAWMSYRQENMGQCLLLTASMLIYLIGVFGVTAIGNVPLNNALEAVNPTESSVEMLAAQRAAFEAPWNQFHAIRTGAALVVLVLTLVACLLQRYPNTP